MEAAGYRRHGRKTGERDLGNCYRVVLRAPSDKTTYAFVKALLKHHENLRRRNPPDVEAWKITFGELCQKAEAGCPSGAGWFLGDIHTRCEKNKLPPLNALVVNAKTRSPGDNYPDTREAWVRHIRACTDEKYPSLNDKMWA